jgi:tryptophan synthase alpha chain
MSRIEAAFRRAAADGRAAFVPYLTAGDPSPEVTPSLVAALERAGADVVELGVPFSDPLADGPVNQRAAQRALAAGCHLDTVLGIASSIRETSVLPMVLFTYFNPVHRTGVERFAKTAHDSGVDGVLITDLPADEAGEHVATLQGAGLDTIFLLAPTSAPERVEQVAASSRGFVYYISRTGVTGDGADLSGSLEQELAAVRRNISLPVAVGFGIKDAGQVRRAAAAADGVVVGSALVEQVEQHAGSHELPARLQEFAATLAAATRRHREGP